jgi:protein regulator of cytokinesis 1
MGNLHDGNNSPERRPRTAGGHRKNEESIPRPRTAAGFKNEDFSSTIRGQAGPPRGATPQLKMKDSFNFPEPTPTPSLQHSNPFELERSSSVLRHVAPEDAYQDSSYRSSYLSASVMGPPPRPSYLRATPSIDSSYISSMSSYSRPPSSRQGYPLAPPSRASSNNSSIMNGSGSENWETYTDASDTEESDATQAFYARQRAQQQQQQQTQQQKFRGGAPVLVGGGGSVKRAMQSPNPKGGMGKKSREVFDEVEGSEAGWTDDGDLGEVY